MDPAGTSPTRSVRPLRIAIVLLLAALAAAGTLAANLAGSEQRVTWKQEYPASATLRVHADAGSVTVTTWDRPQIAVTVEAEWYGDREEPRVTRTGDLLELRTCTQSFRRTFAFWNQRCVASIAVTVPAGTNIDARADTGDIALSGDLGRVEAKADTGAITATAARSRSSFRAQTDTGSLAIDATAPNLVLGTDTGDIRATVSATRVELTADTGSITGTLRRAPSDLRADTDTGAIALTLPAGPYRIETRTDTGSEQIDPRLVDGTSTRIVRVSADTGDIALRLGDAG